MKALVLTGYTAFEYNDVPDPVPGEGEVLIRVGACGICGSDVHGIDGRSGRRTPPLIMGHEASGEIVDIGKGVNSFKAGDRVTFDSTIFCGTCVYCREGLVNLCENRRVAGVSCGEYRQNGAMAELIAVPERILYKLPDSVGFVEGAMIEGLSIAFHAVNMTPIRLGDSSLVIGAGPIGLLILQALRVKGCGNIYVADLDDTRLETARKLGADAVINPSKTSVEEYCLEKTGDLGVDRVFEAVGNTPAVAAAVSAARKNGSVTLVGNITPLVEFPLQKVVTRQIQVYSSCASAGEYPVCLEMVSRGAVNVRELVSAEAPLSEGGEWFRRLYAKEPGLLKVVLIPGTHSTASIGSSA